MCKRVNVRGCPKITGAAAGVVAILFLASCSGQSNACPGESGGSSRGAGDTGTKLTYQNLLTEMSPGINLGNSLEAVPENYRGAVLTLSAETAWGNPVPNQAIFNAYKAAGFKSVRIPLAWNQYSDTNSNIAPFWMSHVKEVVDHARRAGLYVMINIHWDGGWMNQTNYPRQAEIQAKIIKFWTQIANSFKDYDDHLLFAGLNEVGQDGSSSGPTAEYCAVQNSYNQAFVNAVRATGGSNATRFLVVQAYWTSTEHAVGCNKTLPTDPASHRLAIEVHYYSPYNFALNGDSNIWQWGAKATNPKATETWANETETDTIFQQMKTIFVDQGVPVIVGEYGAYLKPKYPDMNDYRKDWIRYVTKSMYSHGSVPMWWDTGELFDRSTGAPKKAETIGWIVDSAK